jgi:translation initiation factor IF-1
LAKRRGRGGGKRKRVARGPREPRDDKIVLDGEVVEALPNTMFRVKADNGLDVLATLSGRMRRFYVRVLLGDRVQVEVSPYDPQKGRVTYRYRS